VVVPISNRALTFGEGFRPDGLMDDSVTCELKAVETMPPFFIAQLLNYFKVTQKRLEFLVNFNVPTLKQGIMRMIL
jgi:GxxExxY protein